MILHEKAMIESLKELGPFIPGLLRASLINIGLFFSLITVGFAVGTLEAG